MTDKVVQRMSYRKYLYALPTRAWNTNGTNAFLHMHSEGQVFLTSYRLKIQNIVHIRPTVGIDVMQSILQAASYATLFGVSQIITRLTNVFV